MQYNVKSVHKKYSSDVPRFLHCKPKLLVDHCLQRLPTDHPSVIKEVEVGPKKFKVTSYDSGKVYEIDLGQSLPSCTCSDWLNTHWPCKHMLHVILNIPGNDWDSLSEDFIGAPHMCCDIEVFQVTSSNDHCQDDDHQITTRNNPVASDRQSNSRSVSSSKKTIAVATKCKTLASSISNMLYLVRDKSDYEDIYVDLLSLHKKLVSKIPKQSGLFLRQSKRGRMTQGFHHGHIKLRKRRKNKKKQGILRAFIFLSGLPLPKVFY